MLVAPVVILEVVGELAVVFHRLVDEEGDSGENGFAKFFGLGCFTVAEEGKKGEGGHGHLAASTPRAVLILLLLEPAKRVDHGIFTLLGAAIGLKTRKAVGK